MAKRQPHKRKKKYNKPDIGRDAYRVLDERGKILEEEGVPNLALVKAQSIVESAAFGKDGVSRDLRVVRETLGIEGSRVELYQVSNEGKTITTITLSRED